MLSLTANRSPSLAILGISDAYLRRRGLKACEEAQAAELVLADTGAEGREFLLQSGAAGAWQALKASAAADGITLVLESAFRSVARQTEILRTKLDAGVSIDQALLLVAPPGYSEHHTGRAVDIGTPGSMALEEEFETTTAYAWLRQHAGAHGFTMSYPRGNAQGYAYEPWHWCYKPGFQPETGWD